MKEKELNTVLNFIENWQMNNIYDPSLLYEFNSKFRKDMQAFFNKSDFKTITVNEIIN